MVSLLVHVHAPNHGAARERQVVGVDGVRKAAHEFVQENQLTSDPPAAAGGMEVLELHRGGRAGFPIRFVVGDFLRLTPDVAGTFEARRENVP